MKKEKILNIILAIIARLEEIDKNHTSKLYKKSELWPQAIKRLKKEYPNIKPQAFYSAVGRLHDEKYISFINKNKISYIKITRSGIDKLENQYRKDLIAKMIISKPKKWNGRWKVVIFDIPESKRKIRDMLRERLKSLGFYHFQDSVFIHPFASINQIRKIRDFYNVSQYVKIIGTDFFEGDNKIRRHFKI